MVGELNPHLGLIEDVLHTPGIGVVDGLEIFTPIREEVDRLVQLVAKELSAADPCLGFTPCLSGSTHDGSKVGFPNEFDYLLYVDGLLENVEFDDSDTQSGYVRLKIVDGKKNKSNIFADKNGYFDSIKFTSYFHKALFNVFKEENLWKQFDLSWEYGGVFPPNQSKVKASNFYIELRSPDIHFGQIHLSIDFVPVSRIPGAFWPSCFISKDNPLMKDTTGNLCVVLMKYYRKDTVEFTNQIRLSMSELETDLFSSMSDIHKHAFMFIKALTSILKTCSHKDTRPIINTYVIKTVLFHALTKESETVHYDNKEIAKFAVTLLQGLLEASNKETLGSFFFPKLDIFDSLFTSFGRVYPGGILNLIDKIKLCGS